MPNFEMPVARRVAGRSTALAGIILATATLAIAAADPAADRGAQLFAQRKDVEARAILAPLAAAKPPSTTAAYYLGRIAMRADEPKEAARWFEVAAKGEASNSDYQFWLGRAYGEQAQRAGKLSQIGLAKKTRAAFERASVLDPDNLDARDGLIQYYLQAPGIVGGSVTKAREQSAQVKKRDAYRGALAEVAIAEDQKDYAGAESLLRSAMSTHPDSLGLRYRLAALLTRNERWDDAFEMYEGILKKKPDDWNALYAVGRTGALSGQRLERAQSALETFLEEPRGDQSPKPVGAHWRLGMIHERAGRKDAARAEYQKALAIDPKFEDAKKSLSELK